jgi:DivIVA domain-containing protein
MTLQANDHSPSGFRRLLTPERIRSVVFTKTPLGRRGIDPDEVELFQHRLAEEIAAMDVEAGRLRAENDRLRNWYREHGDSTIEAVVPIQVDVEAINLLSEAQLQAEAYVAQAEAHARRVTVEARHHADAILHDAQQHAEAAAHHASQAYRSRAGQDYAAELEELERRLAWLRAFCHAVQVQLHAASDAFTQEIDKLARLPEHLGPHPDDSRR